LKYPRPNRQEPLQAGLFLLHPPSLPMFIKTPELVGAVADLPDFTVKDVAFLTAMGISPDLRAQP